MGDVAARNAKLARAAHSRTLVIALCATETPTPPLRQIAKQTLKLGYAPFPAQSPASSARMNLAEITHYHTTAVSPSWGKKIEKIATIGAHIFYRSERVAKSL